MLNLSRSKVEVDKRKVETEAEQKQS